MTPIEHVEKLANALDQDDYTTVTGVLSDDVVYRVGDRVLTGRDAVIASYAAASEMAHRLFDDVEYDHRVIATDDPHVFRVMYSDLLTVAGETHTHRAEQHVTVLPDVGVVAILDVEVAGEREKIDEFMARHGLSRRA